MIINERDGMPSTEPLTFGRNLIYTGKIPYSNGSYEQDMIPYSNVINRQYINPCSNRQVILRIQSGTDGDLENSSKKMYHENSPKNIDPQ